MAMRMTIRPGGTGLCPMCREAISREAKKCPHCHSDLTSIPEWQNAENKSGLLPLVVVGVILAGIACWWLTRH